MKVALFLILLFCVVSCDPPYIEDNPYLPNKGSLANEVTNKTLIKLKKEKELYPCGIGSRMMHQIKMLALGFHYYKEIDIGQARELLIDSSEEFLNRINSTERIHQFLENFPFQPKNIQIRIFLQKPNGSEPELDKLIVVSMIGGILEYDVRDSETKRLKTIYKETYEEAEAKLSLQNKMN